MVELIIVILLVLLLIVLLVAPVKIQIDSSNNHYQFGIPYLASVQIVPDEWIAHLEMQVLFVPFNISIKKIIQKSANKKSNKNKIRKRGKMGLSATRYFRPMLKALKVRSFNVNFDTGHEIANAWLTSITIPVNTNNINIGINYSREFYCDIHIYTRLIFILKAIIITNYHNKN